VSGWDQVLRQFGLHDLLLDQLVEGVETLGSSILKVALCPCGVVLEGDYLSLELLVEFFSPSCSRRIFSHSSVVCSPYDRIAAVVPSFASSSR